ncbi:DUF6493 family protein [Streptomyces sp. NPDC057301]|uniref:DUF7824 domain-containing protein n=1 Tax=Streptomyces sp. NPDC057301 TaxID=3346093 RepID=UPI00363E37F4
MDEFGRWLSRFTDGDGPIGELARRMAVDPDWPVASSPRQLSFFFYAEHFRDMPGELRTAWPAFVRDAVHDRALPALPGEGEPAAENYECLVAVLEGGSLEQLIPLLRTVKLDPGQRDELLARATDATTMLSIEGWNASMRKRADRHYRMVIAGLACHPDAEAASAWLRRKGVPDGAEQAVVGIVGSKDPAWLEEFTRRLAEGKGARRLYGLVTLLARDKAVSVEATHGLALGCLSQHGSAARDAQSATEEAILDRLRQDPLAPSVLPLITIGQDSDWGSPGSRHNTVPFAGAKFLAVAASSGFLDRAALIADVTAALSAPRHRGSDTDGLVALMEHLAPTEAEFAPCHDTWVRLLQSVPGMRKALLVRAVDGLARADRFPGDVMDAWIEVIQGNDVAHARTAIAGLVALKGDPRYLSDEQVTAVLRFVATGSGSRASAAVALLKSFAAAGRLTVDQVAQCAREALFRPEKSLVTSMIALLGQVLRDDPELAGNLVPLLADAFGHTSADVQEKALALAETHAGRLDAPERHALAAAAEQLIPALRTRAWTVFGGDGHPPQAEPEEAPSLLAPAPGRVAPPVDSVAGAVEELAAVLRARVPDPVTCERAMDALVRWTHQDRAAFATALRPLLKSFGWKGPTTGADLAGSAKPLLAAVAVVESAGLGDSAGPGEPSGPAGPAAGGPGDPAAAPGGPGGPVSVTNEVVAAHTAVFPADLNGVGVHDKMPCGHAVFDRVLHARWAEVIRRLRDHDTTPLLLATPTWSNGTIAAGDLVERLAAYHRSQARPGRVDLEQALLRVRHDDAAERAATAAEALGTPEALRLARWLRDQGLAVPETVLTPLEARQHDTWWEEREPWRLRAAVPDFTDRLHDFGEPFRELAGSYLADGDHCGVYESEGAWPRLLPLWLMILPRHREIVAARTLTAFAEGAESSRRSAAVHLPALADAEGPAGTAVRLALAHGLGAHRPAERVAAADAFLMFAARQDLDEEQFGRDLAALLTGPGCLKVSRVIESLTLAAQGGAHPDVAIVLAWLLSGRLGDGTVPAAGLGKLLTLAAECAERSRRPLPPVDGLSELAARRGSALVVKSARRLRDAMTPFARHPRQARPRSKTDGRY